MGCGSGVADSQRSASTWHTKVHPIAVVSPPAPEKREDSDDKENDSTVVLFKSEKEVLCLGTLLFSVFFCSFGPEEDV